MIDIKKKYKTRSGLDVRLVSDQGHLDFPIVGYIGNSIEPTCWDCDGSFTYQKDHCDLVEVKEKKVMYVNVYPSDKHYFYFSRESADINDSYVTGARLARIRVEYEEGQFDE